MQLLLNLSCVNELLTCNPMCISRRILLDRDGLVLPISFLLLSIFVYHDEMINYVCSHMIPFSDVCYNCIVEELMMLL